MSTEQGQGQRSAGQPAQDPIIMKLMQAMVEKAKIFEEDTQTRTAGTSASLPSRTMETPGPPDATTTCAKTILSRDQIVVDRLAQMGASEGLTAWMYKYIRLTQYQQGDSTVLLPEDKPFLKLLKEHPLPPVSRSQFEETRTKRLEKLSKRLKCTARRSKPAAATAADAIGLTESVSSNPAPQPTPGYEVTQVASAKPAVLDYLTWPPLPPKYPGVVAFARLNSQHRSEFQAPYTFRGLDLAINKQAIETTGTDQNKETITTSAERTSTDHIAEAPNHCETQTLFTFSDPDTDIIEQPIETTRPEQNKETVTTSTEATSTNHIAPTQNRKEAEQASGAIPRPVAAKQQLDFIDIADSIATPSTSKESVLTTQPHHQQQAQRQEEKKQYRIVAPTVPDWVNVLASIAKELGHSPNVWYRPKPGFQFGPRSEEEYHCVLRHLSAIKENGVQLEYYTMSPHEQMNMKAAVRGLPHNTPYADIRKAFETYGRPVDLVRQIDLKGEGSSCIYYIQFAGPPRDNSDIYGCIELPCFGRVEVEAWQGKRRARRKKATKQKQPADPAPEPTVQSQLDPEVVRAKLYEMTVGCQQLCQQLLASIVSASPKTT